MNFKPYVDECTTFINVRILKFNTESIKITFNTPEEGRKVFSNTKPFNLYYDTSTLKIMNVLEEIKLKSQKEDKSKSKRIKLNSSLAELVNNSNIEKLLKEWKSLSASSVKV